METPRYVAMLSAFITIVLRTDSHTYTRPNTLDHVRNNCCPGVLVIYYTPTTDNQLEKEIEDSLEHKMKTGVMYGIHRV